MHQFSYHEFVDDAPVAMRAQECQTMTHAIGLLKIAREAGPTSREMIEALYFLQRLWGIFTEDLTNGENELPVELRANLISIGLWVVKEIGRIRSGQATDVTPLIEINEIIRDGLK